MIRRSAVVIALAGALVAVLVGAPSPRRAAAAGVAATSRLGGADRYGTAAAIAERSFPEQADVVYVTRGDVVADGLAAGALTDGPVLLVPREGPVPDAVRAAVDRLAPAQIVAIGGTAAVSDATVAAAADGRAWARLAGRDRYDTAVAVSRRAFPDGASRVHLASGAGGADAVAGGALTAGPVLLVPPSGPVPDEVLDEVDRLDPADVVVLGGAAALADGQVESIVGERPWTRLAGPDRYATAVAVSSHQFPDGAPTAYLARGDAFGDAVASGSLSDGPILLVPPCGRVPAPVLAELERLDVSSVVAIGGVSAVCDDLLANAAELDPALTVTILCRDAWGAAAPTGPGRAHDITGLMVHHSGVLLTDNRDAPSRFRRHQRYHQDQGWPDIAYHVGVDRHGNLYELRSPAIAGDTFTEYDPSGWLLVMAEGDFDRQSPSAEQLEGLAEALAWGATRFGVPSDVAAHRDVASTTCPGRTLYGALADGTLPTRVRELVEAGGVEFRLVCGAEGADRVAAIEAGTDA